MSVKVKYIPNILEREGWEEKTFPYDRRKNALDYLKESGFPILGNKVILSGRKLDEINSRLDFGDEIIVTPDIGEPVSGTIAAISAFLTSTAITFGTIGATTYGLTWAGVAMLSLSAGYAVYSYTQQPKMPSFGSISPAGALSSLDAGSQTYGWIGIQTTQSVGTPMPIIYGEHRVGGNIINSYIWSDGEKQYLNLLLALGHGELESIDNILINENPIANFSGITVYKRYGTNSQTVIQHFEDLHNTHNVNVQLTKDNPYTYTTIKTDVEAFEVHIQFPSGVFQQDEKTGEIKSWSVIHKIEYRVNGGGDYTLLGNFTYSAKSRTNVKKVYRKENLPPNKYDIKITRISDNSSFYKSGDSYLQLIDEIECQDLSYPCIALLGLRMLATEQLSGTTPNVTSIAKGKVSAPKVMDGANQVPWEDYYWDPDYNGGQGAFRLFSDDTVLSWDGNTYVDQFCANAIWCLKDLLINDYYGLGEYIDSSLINSSMLVEMAKYCEEKIPYVDDQGDTKYRKRFKLNVVIDSLTRALELIIQLAGTFRGIPFWSQGAIYPKIDKPESPVQMFGMGNIIQGSLKQHWKSIKDHPNVLEIQFLDKYKDYKQEQVSIIDEAAISAGEQVRKQSLRLFVTTPEEALYQGRYAIKIAKHIDRAIEFKAGIDGILAQAGNPISMSHDVPQWGYSGRVLSGTTTSVVLDREITIEQGKSYEVSVQLSDDILEVKTVTNSPGTTDTLTISGAFSSAPQKYDKYAFGEVNISTKPYRVIGIRRENKGEAVISALKYDSNIYDDTVVTVPQTNYSALQIEIPNVANLVLTERIVKLKDGTIENVIDVWFDLPIIKEYLLGCFDQARIFISDNDGESWNPVGETTGRHFQIMGDLKDLVTYKIAVASVNKKGMQNAISKSPQASHLLIGKSAPPSDVTYFNVEQAEDFLIFSWDPVPDVDVPCYELRRGITWETASLIDTIFDGTIYQLPYFLSGTHTYWLKAKDRSKNYSLNGASATITVVRRPGLNVSAVDKEFGRVGEADEMRIDKELMWEYNCLYSNNYFRKSVIPKTQVRWDEDDLDYETAEKGNYEYDGEREIGSFKVCSKAYDMGDVLDVLFQMQLFILFDQGVSVLHEIRDSQDNIEWTDWRIYSPGFVSARYFQLRLTFILTSGKKFALYDWLNEFDVADIEQEGIDIDVPIAGEDVVFERVFTTIINSLSVAAMKSGTALVPVVDPILITLTQFNVKLRNPETEAYEAGKISYRVKGY